MQTKILLLPLLVMCFAMTGCSKTANGPHLMVRTSARQAFVFTIPTIKIISDEDGSVTIQRVIINNRIGQENCDITEKTNAQLPAPLQRGDTVEFNQYCSAETVTVDVVTDKGTSSYTFNKSDSDDK